VRARACMYVCARQVKKKSGQFGENGRVPRTANEGGRFHTVGILTSSLVLVMG
jgi:hypothetical protein